MPQPGAARHENDFADLGQLIKHSWRGPHILIRDMTVTSPRNRAIAPNCPWFNWNLSIRRGGETIPLLLKFQDTPPTAYLPASVVATIEAPRLLRRSNARGVQEKLVFDHSLFSLDVPREFLPDPITGETLLAYMAAFQEHRSVACRRGDLETFKRVMDAYCDISGIGLSITAAPHESRHPSHMVLPRRHSASEDVDTYHHLIHCAERIIRYFHPFGWAAHKGRNLIASFGIPVGRFPSADRTSHDLLEAAAVLGEFLNSHGEIFESAQERQRLLREIGLAS